MTHDIRNSYIVVALMYVCMYGMYVCMYVHTYGHVRYVCMTLDFCNMHHAM